MTNKTDMDKLVEGVWANYLRDNWSMESFDEALSQGMDINAKCPEKFKMKAGYTFLHCAVMFGEIEFVRALLERGADFTAVNNENETALMTSSDEGLDMGDVVGSVRCLLKAGADPNEVTTCFWQCPGKTLLMILADNNYDENNDKALEIAESLLEFGATVLLKDAEGQTAWDFAKENYGGNFMGSMRPYLEQELKVIMEKKRCENLRYLSKHTAPKPRRRSIYKGR